MALEPHIVVLQHWPLPDTVTPATVVRTGSKLIVGYGTEDDAYACITFSQARNLKAGGPNDETLHGHPLFAYGLKHYSIHRIENSPWLIELERQNSVHAHHDRSRFMKDKVHYLFALKEETVECIVVEPPGRSPRVEVFASQDLGAAVEAESFWNGSSSK